MLLNTVKAEWTKLHTTRSFWWTTAVFLFFAWGWAILNASLSGQVEGAAELNLLSPQSATPVLLMLGLPVLIIQATMVITTEYRYGVQTTVYMANPRRWMVAVVKYFLYAIFAAFLVFVAIVGAYLLTSVFAPEDLADGFKPFSDDAGRRLLWLYPLATAILVLFSQGVGLLLRQTAGAVSISLILYLGIDSFVQLIPKVGERIIDFMPFTAFNNWLADMEPSQYAWWDSATGSGVVFFCWSLALWILGAFLLIKRDA
ncbi:ABC transporter permease [Corynebacterium flavescens]|uniref:ABC transporter permease n=1 Tax=Corynebacterium flavescens TaxID=28028 RepID=A0A1L7CPA7_CORFL|nr:ABC transporter permease [Corynebacterium flavescens]APT87682.1 ABC transporter permease [Corynebacterium flavescens]